jgi:hypothetical protein
MPELHGPADDGGTGGRPLGTGHGSATCPRGRRPGRAAGTRSGGGARGRICPAGSACGARGRRYPASLRQAAGPPRSSHPSADCGKTRRWRRDDDGAGPQPARREVERPDPGRDACIQPLHGRVTGRVVRRRRQGGGARPSPDGERTRPRQPAAPTASAAHGRVGPSPARRRPPGAGRRRAAQFGPGRPAPRRAAHHMRPGAPRAGGRPPPCWTGRCPNCSGASRPR